MIQRVQSLYLLLITILMSLMVVLPYAELILGDGQTITFHSYAIEKTTYQDVTTVYKSTVPVIALILIACLLSFGNIFLFTRRIWQLRICLFIAFFLILLLIFMYAYYHSANKELELSARAFEFPGIFPIVALLLNFLVYLNIRNDEMLVNSYKRIR